MDTTLFLDTSSGNLGSADIQNWFREPQENPNMAAAGLRDRPEVEFSAKTQTVEP